MISVIIPANNEEGYIGECLDLMLASRGFDDPQDSGTLPPQFIVVANACTDRTVEEAQERSRRFSESGWRLDVLDLEEGGKINALNAGDAAAIHDCRVYVDADIHVTPQLLPEIAGVLQRSQACYAGGRPRIRKAASFFSERYARFWERLPFMARGVPGCGVYGVNAAGRARWSRFPDIIADDTFVRYHFAPDEMRGVPASYSWPITEGLGNLVRVRRRQDQGLEEIRNSYPELAEKMQPTAPSIGEKLGLLMRDPLGYVIYASVAVFVRTPLFRNRATWERGR